MKSSYRLIVLVVLLSVLTLSCCSQVIAFQQKFVVGHATQHRPSSPGSSLLLSSSQEQKTIERVTKTEEEWKQELSPEAYYVLREEGTERPNSSELNFVKDSGTFVCAGCGNPLFTTSTKYESGTGWPSFYAPIDRAAVNLKLDLKLGLPRTEVLCAACDGHLGHVFEGTYLF